MDTVVDALFDLTPAVRYVAFYQDGDLHMHKRPDIGKPTASESDHYEELLVNPAILTLAGKWGTIDCGGLECVVVRCGSFYQFIVPAAGNHDRLCSGCKLSLLRGPIP